MKALLLAAGLGTRLRNETKDKPKALVEVKGKPLLFHAINKLMAEGVDGVVINVHHYADQIIQYVSQHNFGIPIMISDEREQLLDTGGALKHASRFFTGNDESVIIYNVDILCHLNLTDPVGEHLSSGALATLVVRQRETDRYLKFNAGQRLVGWMNKKTGEKRVSIPEAFDEAKEMAFSGIHIVNPQIFQLMPEVDRFSIIDFYLDLASTHLIKGYFDASEYWMDIGKPDQLALARRIWNG